MKIFAPNDDDFFAPREKLSEAALKIRVIAFLLAIGVSVPCVNEIRRYLAAYIDGRAPFLYGWPFYLGLQLLFVIPCWRAWCLKRWACWTVFHLLTLVNLWMLMAASLLRPFCWGAAAASMAWLLLGFYLMQEDKQLKSGF